jgi:peptidoglycan-N-acetylglucosamine deacetylase
MKRKYFMYLILLSNMLWMTLGVFNNPFNAMSVASNVKSDFASLPQIKKDDLLKKIQAFSDQHKIEPIDAKVDRVWRAIPGYNGLGVNIEASYKEMENNGVFDESKVVYEEIPPNVHLEDLVSEPIYRGNPQKAMVALLINVAWGNEHIPEILKILNGHQTKATFFFDGSWVKKNPDLARLIKEAGHEIGNHAYSHPDLKQRTRGETLSELQKTNDIIQETIGIKPKWFAPPSGSFNQATIQVADQLQMKTILWTVDTVDWKKPSATEMVRRVVSKVENGSMILMHPTKPVAEGLGMMITEMKEKGYQLGTVSDLMSEKRIESR